MYGTAQSSDVETCVRLSMCLLKPFGVQTAFKQIRQFF